MNNAQFYTLLVSSLSALVVVALGLVSNNKRLDDMRSDLKELRTLIGKLGEDYTRFYGEQRKHDAEIGNLSA